jgi:hypothetical protein
MASLVVGTKAGLFELALPRGGAVAAAPEGGPVTALAARGAEVWAAFGGTTLHHRTPDGSWSTLAGVDARHAIVSLLPATPGLWVGTAGARLFRLQGDGLATVESFDRIDERVDWYTPWGGPPDTRSLASDGDAVYVNVHVGGILRSADGGGSWQQTIDIHADVHQVVAGDGGLVVAATARGLAASRDGGATWGFVDRGLHAAYARAVALLGGTVFLSASEGPGGRRSAVYRAPLTLDEPFVRCTDGLPEWFGSNVDTACLVAARGMVVLGTEGGSLYASADGGACWEEIAGDLPPVTCLAAAG